jgi:hypothetical protein
MSPGVATICQRCVYTGHSHRTTYNVLSVYFSAIVYSALDFMQLMFSTSSSTPLPSSTSPSSDLVSHPRRRVPYSCPLHVLVYSMSPSARRLYNPPASSTYLASTPPLTATALPLSSLTRRQLSSVVASTQVSPVYFASHSQQQ